MNKDDYYKLNARKDGKFFMFVPYLLAPQEVIEIFKAIVKDTGITIKDYQEDSIELIFDGDDTQYLYIEIQKRDIFFKTNDNRRVYLEDLGAHQHQELIDLLKESKSTREPLSEC